MKKTIILILVLLPFVLISIISVAGRVLSLVKYISVEEVAFVDRAGSHYTDDTVFKVAQGSSRDTQIIIYPELATNKSVSYSSSDPSTCIVDQNGVITGVHWGTATVTVKTKDSSKIALLNVLVTADIPFDVTLSHKEILMFTGGIFDKLKENVDAPVSIDKSVIWSSSNTNVVEVDELLGIVKAKAPGEAFITVTTVSGGKTSSCKVIVTNGSPFQIDLSGIEGIEDKSDENVKKCIIKIHELDLSKIIKLGDDVLLEDITFKIDKEDMATINDNVLTFNIESAMVINLYAECEKDGVNHKMIVQFMYLPV